MNRQIETGENKYSEFLAEKYGVALENVSFARTGRTAEESAVNDVADGAMKTTVSFSGQKVEMVGSIRI